MDDVYIDSTGGVTTSPSPAPPTLGHVETTCASCGREWLMTQAACASCGGHELVQRVIAGTLIERVGGRIKAVVLPSKPKPPRASVEQVAALRGFAASVRLFQAELAQQDVALSAAARAGVEQLVPAHGAIHRALATSGDAAPASLDTLALGLQYLVATLDRTLASIEEDDSR